jgi:hypothetical protein
MHYIHYSHFQLIYLFREYMVRCFVFVQMIIINSLARIIDLQVCAWLKQDPIESDRISTWIETHRDVFQVDGRMK